MFEQAFPIVIIGEHLDGKHAGGRAVRQLADALGDQGFRVVTGVGYHDARRLARVYHNESSLLISVDDASDYAIPVYGEGRGLPHVELEIRQDLLADEAGQDAWAHRLADVLRRAERMLTPP